MEDRPREKQKTEKTDELINRMKKKPGQRRVGKREKKGGGGGRGRGGK